MIAWILVWTGVALGQTGSQPPATTPTVPRPTTLDAELTQTLLSAKRIYVESFGDDTINRTLQAMVMDAIGNSKRFIITENKEKADLLLKGSSLEKTTQEMHALASSTSVGGAAGGGSSQVSGQANSVGATVSGSSQGGFVARKLGISDSQASVDTVNDARASVRLISKDGDMVWSTTQESKGSKYKGATADVADKIVKQLMRDLAKAEEHKAAQK